jgi:hypothetical protein
MGPEFEYELIAKEDWIGRRGDAMNLSWKLAAHLKVTMLRFDVSIGIEPIMSAAAEAGIPIELLDVTSTDARHVYRHKLLLNRPDGHVPWRGDAAPVNAAEFIALISARKVKLAATTNCWKLRSVAARGAIQ